MRNVVGAALGFLLSSSLCAQDWPGWRGAGHDGKASGFQAPASWPEELRRGWQVEVGEGHASPALADGRYFLHVRQGDSEVALCLDAATGKELWREALEVKYDPPPDAKSYGKGPFASPLVAGGRVYTFGIKSTLSCLDARTGKLLWRADFKDRFPKPEAEWGTAASPVLVDGKVVVHVGGGPGKHRDGKGRGGVVALDAADGTVKWAWEGDCAGSATPVPVTVGGVPQLVTQTESLAVGLSPADGKLLWELEFKSQYNQNAVTPVVLGDLAILSGYQMGVRAYRIGGPKPEPAWQTREASMFMSSPILKGDRLYGFSEMGSGQFFCLDAKSSETMWTGEARQGTNAALVDAGAVLLGLVTPGPTDRKPSHLVVFGATDKEYEEKARYKVSDGPAFAHPVLSGKTIAIKDRTKFALWTLP